MKGAHDEAKHVLICRGQRPRVVGLRGSAGVAGCRVLWAGVGAEGYGRGMRVAAVLIDIDGVLTVSWRPLPGAVAALRRLRSAGLPLALVTNTTSRSRA